MDEFNLAKSKFILLDYIPLGSFVLREDFTVIFWNKYLEYWTGIPREKIIGISIDTYYPHLKQNKYLYRLQQLFRHGLPTIFSSEIHQSLIPCLIRENKPMLQYTTVTPISAPSGQGCYALFLLQDVTDITDRLRKFKTMEIRALEEVKERKQIQEKLEQRNLQLEKLNDLSKLLQECNNIQDAYQLLANKLGCLFEKLNGGLLIYESKDNIREITRWGIIKRCKVNSQKDYFSDLFRHKIPTMEFKKHDHLNCYFFSLIARDDPLGILYLTLPQGEEISESQKLFALTVSEHISLILANIKLRESLENLSIRDHLTGLYNRRYLEKVFKQELSRAERNSKPLGVIIADLDHFKNFNDTFGHQMGDYLLQSLGTCLQKNTRSYDIVCRYGGEEFLIILPEASLKETLQRAEDLAGEIKKISLEEYLSPKNVRITVSMGVASFPEHGSSGAALILAADLALYHAKREGRDRIACAPEKEK